MSWWTESIDKTTFSFAFWIRCLWPLHRRAPHPYSSIHMNPPRFWTNPILLWWTLAAFSFGTILLLRPALMNAFATPKPFLSVQTGPSETVRLCRDDSDIRTTLSWEYFGNGVHARGHIGLMGYETDISTIPLQVARLNSSIILIVDPDRRELLAAIDTSNMPPIAITHDDHPRRFSVLAAEAATQIGLPLEPNLTGEVRKWAPP